MPSLEDQIEFSFPLDQIVQKLTLDRIIDQERAADHDSHSPLGGCMIQMPGHPSYFYSDVTSKAARSAAAQVGASYRFKPGFPRWVGFRVSFGVVCRTASEAYPGRGGSLCFHPLHPP